MNPPAGRVPGIVLTSPDGGEITLHAFPNDARFIRDIRRASLAVGNRAGTEGELRGDLVRALRPWYPLVEIRAREELADLSGQDHVWYVIRDGRIGRTSTLIDRLHAVMSDARETSAESDRAVQRSRTMLDLARRPRARSGGRRFDGPTHHRGADGDA